MEFWERFRFYKNGKSLSIELGHKDYSRFCNLGANHKNFETNIDTYCGNMCAYTKFAEIQCRSFLMVDEHCHHLIGCYA